MLALLLAGCGEDSTGPTPDELFRGPIALAVVSGAAQADTVQATLRTPITVRLTTGAAAPVPIPGQTINFVVLEAGCGRPFAGSATTSSDGIAAERWELGTVAKTCTMEARAVDPDGTPRVFATVQATVLPGQAVQFRAGAPRAASAWAGEWLDVQPDVIDRHGNIVPADHLTVVVPQTLEYSGNRARAQVETQTKIVFVEGMTLLGDLDVAWISDLRKKTWEISFSCVGYAAHQIDSLRVQAAVDSIQYPAPPGRGSTGGNTVMWLSGTATSYRGAESTVVPVKTTVGIYQRPGSIELSGGEGMATADAGIPTRYEGGNWCARRLTGYDPGVWASWTPGRMQGRP